MPHAKNLVLISILILFINQCASQRVYYVDINGNDTTGNGSLEKPWRTLFFAAGRVPGNEGHTIKLSAGRFIERDFIRVPPGVNITGAGIGVTILTADTPLYNPTSAWVFDKFLLSLVGSGGDRQITQALNNFSIDGAGKKLYGAILVRDRDNVVLSYLDIRDTYYTGIWLWGTKACRVTQVQLKNCAWGSSAGCSATIHFSASEDLEIDHLNVEEDIGYGIKAVGDGKMYNLKIHHSQFWVNPKGKWKTPAGHAAPNIACELYNVDLKNCAIYNNYFSANLSIAMDKNEWRVPPDYQTIRVYNNIFDFTNNKEETGHGIELTLHNVEVDHNYFSGGSTSIVNWDASANAHTMYNWKIHHNIFYKLSSYYPSAVINFFRKGITNAHIYNNTVELSDTSTINFIEVNNAGIASNLKIENNLVINSSIGHTWYPNKLVSVVKQARVVNCEISNNSFYRMVIDSIPGARFINNMVGDPKIHMKGTRPIPYYTLLSLSPLVDKGNKIHDGYEGKSPDIGALEYKQE